VLQLSHRPPNDLKKPLRVKFISNEVVEEGLDEGGVSREFFQLLVSAPALRPQIPVDTCMLLLRGDRASIL
jgi:hypothetical protein